MLDGTQSKLKSHKARLSRLNIPSWLFVNSFGFEEKSGLRKAFRFIEGKRILVHFLLFFGQFSSFDARTFKFLQVRAQDFAQFASLEDSESIKIIYSIEVKMPTKMINSLHENDGRGGDKGSVTAKMKTEENCLLFRCLA